MPEATRSNPPDLRLREEPRPASNGRGILELARGALKPVPAVVPAAAVLPPQPVVNQCRTVPSPAIV